MGSRVDRVGMNMCHLKARGECWPMLQEGEGSPERTHLMWTDRCLRNSLDPSSLWLLIVGADLFHSKSNLFKFSYPLKNTFMGAGELAQSVQYLLSKQEDGNSLSGDHIKSGRRWRAPGTAL